MDGELRQLFRKHLPKVFWHSIESGMTGRGVPDSHFCYQSIAGWIEYKQTRGWAVGMRPEQVGWALQYARAGGRSFVAVRRRVAEGTRRGAADELWLVRGTGAAALKAGGPRGLPSDSLAGQWSGGPAAWAWDAVLAALVSPLFSATNPPTL